MMIHPAIEYKIMDCLLYILSHKTSDYSLNNDFPPSHLYNEEGFLISDPDFIAKNVKIKALYLISKLKHNYIAYFLNINEKKHSIIKNRESELNNLSIFIELLSQKIIRNNKSYLNIFADILNEVCIAINSNKKEFKNFFIDKISIKTFCEILLSNSINENIYKKFSNCISIFCSMQSNINVLIDNLKQVVSNICPNLNFGIEKYISSISNEISQNSLILNKLDIDFEEETTIYKVVKIIKNLLENSFQVLNQENMVKIKKISKYFMIFI